MGWLGRIHPNTELLPLPFEIVLQTARKLTKKFMTTWILRCKKNEFSKVGPFSFHLDLHTIHVT